MPEGLRVLEAAARRFDIPLQFDHFDFACCDYYERHGAMMPANWRDLIGGHEAIFFGAVGWPALVPDHVSLWGSLIKFRREFDQYVNLRPCRLMPGVASPLAGLAPGDFDCVIVRENTEGEYSSIGGRMFEGTDREFVVQETVMTRYGVDRRNRSASRRPRSAPGRGCPTRRGATPRWRWSLRPTRPCGPEHRLAPPRRGPAPGRARAS